MTPSLPDQTLELWRAYVQDQPADEIYVRIFTATEYEAPVPALVLPSGADPVVVIDNLNVHPEVTRLFIIHTSPATFYNSVTMEPVGPTQIYRGVVGIGASGESCLIIAPEGYDHQALVIHDIHGPLYAAAIAKLTPPSELDSLLSDILEKGA